MKMKVKTNPTNKIHVQNNKRKQDMGVNCQLVQEDCKYEKKSKQL